MSEGPQTPNSDQPVRWTRGDAIAAAALLLCFPAFFGSAVVFRRFFFLDDIFVHFYPHWAYVGRHLASGVVPLWCPEIFCGFPIASNPQFGPWYLPNWICFLLFSPPGAINLVILGHYLLASLGTFLFARSIKLSSVGAFVAAAGYTFSGFVLTYHVAPHGLFTLAWMPAVLWQLEHSFSRRDRAWRHATVAGLMLGMLLLSGHLQLAIYEMAFIGVYGVFRAAQMRGWGSLLLLGWQFFLGLGLFAVQLLPAIELFGQAARSGAVSGATQLQVQSYIGLKQLVEMAAPNFFGGMLTAEGFFYPSFVGVPILFLAILAIMRGRRALTWFFLAVLGCALFLAAGPNTPVYGALCAVFPIAKVFKSPVRAMGLAVFALSMLAGIACSPREGRLLRWRELLLPAVLGLLLVGSLFLKWRYDQAPVRLLAGPPELAALPEEGLAWALRQRPREIMLLALLVALSSIGCLRYREKRLMLAPPGAWHALLVVLSLWTFSRNVIGLSSREIYDHRSSLLDPIEEEQEKGAPFRVFHMDTEDDFLDLTKLKWEGWPLHRTGEVAKASETLRENLCQVYGFHDFFGFSSLSLARYQKFRYSGREAHPIYGAYQVDVLPPFHFLSRANCAYFVVGHRWPDEEQLGPLVSQTPQFWAYRTKSPLSRARIASKVIGVRTGEEALQKLLKEDEPTFPVIEVPEGPSPGAWSSLTTPPDPGHELDPVIVEPVAVSHDSPNRVELEIPAGFKGDGAVVLADTCYPGWSAWVDGSSRPILPADYLFRSVLRKEGEERLTFTFAPFSIRLGLFISIFHLAVCAGVFTTLHRRRQSPD